MAYKYELVDHEGLNKKYINKNTGEKTYNNVRCLDTMLCSDLQS